MSNCPTAKKQHWLVVYLPSEKYDFVSWDYEIPNILKNKKCSKPPTRLNVQKWCPPQLCGFRFIPLSKFDLSKTVSPKETNWAIVNGGHTLYNTFINHLGMGQTWRIRQPANFWGTVQCIICIRAHLDKLRVPCSKLAQKWHKVSLFIQCGLPQL